MTSKNKTYHYDSEDGLIEEIEKLTAPPGKLNKLKNSNTHNEKDAPVSQKSWKSVNTQYCIVCREGGELLCCDTCPASFHLMCHQPIIWRDQIPEGKWMCNRCENTPVEQIPAKSTIDPNETDDTRNRRAALRVMAGSESTDDPLSLLAQAALVINAQQFELPAELRKDDCYLPYEELSTPRQPIFGEKCAYCQRSNDDQQQVRCDFCPYVYHLDCLNPPLCALPKERWMCPNHVESIVDHKLLKSISITERRALWNKYARQELDEITITRRFFDKIKSDKLKRSGKTLKRPYTKVRSAVKDLYRKRWDGGEDRVQFANNSERREWINAMAAMHSDITIGKLLSNRPALKAVDRSRKNNNMESVIHEETKGIDQKNNSELSPNSKISLERLDDQLSVAGSSLCDAATLLSFAMGATKCSKTEDNEIDESSPPMRVVPPESQQMCVSPKVSDKQVEKTEVMETLQDSPNDNEEINEYDELSKNSNKKQSDDLLSDCIRRMKESSDDRERRLFALAAERLIQMEKQTVVRPVLSKKPKELSFDKRLFLNDRPIIAVLKAEGYAPIAIQRSVTTLGANDLCHIRLTDFVSPFCAQLARHHATIIFDKVSRRFDLEAVGCQRVEVDGVMYGKETASPKLHCKCKLENMRAIESGAVLRHGSYIVIGCIRFVFASFY